MYIGMQDADLRFKLLSITVGTAPVTASWQITSTVEGGIGGMSPTGTDTAKIFWGGWQKTTGTSYTIFS